MHDFLPTLDVRLVTRGVADLQSDDESVIAI